MNFIKRGFVFYISFIFLTGAILLEGDLSCLAAQTEDIVDTQEENEVFLYAGDLVQLKVYALTRLAISKPGIVEIADASVDKVVLIGKRVGETPMFVWDDLGKHMIYIRVFDDKLLFTKARLEQLLKDAEIEGITLKENVYEGKVVAIGRLVETKKDAFDEIIDRQGFSDSVISLVKEEGKLIQIDVQVTELNTTLDKIMGVDWSEGAPTAWSYVESPGVVPVHNIGELFKIGDFYRTTSIIATVNMLLSEGKARVLSKPSVVVTDGEDATFLVGGEVPITSTSTSESGTVTESVTFQSYGIDLSVTPQIKEKKIDLTTSVVIRDVDTSVAGVGVGSGNNIAFTTRSAKTQLLLEDGQTIVLAGLIKEQRSEAINRVPFLSKIPIIGMFFRSTNYTPHKDTEVVIIITPHILKSEEEGKQAPALAQVGEEEELSEEDVDQKISEILAEDIPEEDLYGDIEEIEQEDEDMSFSMAEEESGEDVPEEEFAEDVDAAEEEDINLVSAAEQEAIPSSASEYAKKIQQRISQKISFPYEAKEKGWSGTVTLSLTLLSDGTLTAVSVKESSGHSVFDKDAVNTAKILAPYEPFPIEMDVEEIVITIPIIYSQDVGLE